MALNQTVPQHIAIIMDGNGRWAKKRGLPRNAGHKAGAETFRRIAARCNELGVKYLTVYAFSTENWKRSEEEVSGIMLLLETYLKEALRDMEKNHIRFQLFGDITGLNPKLQKLCREAMERSAQYHEVQVNFCINYGGRDEILRAARAFAADVAAGNLSRVTGWLKEKIHRHASFRKPGELFESVCGKFDAKYFTDYLTEKFTKLYNL